MKICNKCNEEKPLTDYHVSNSSRDGRQPRCKPCAIRIAREYQLQNPEKHLAQARKYARNNKDRRRDTLLRHQYGISLEGYLTMYQTQGGVCALCGLGEIETRRKALSVDHCHVTGKVRALLCSACNKGLGCYRDDPELLRKAAEYLDKHGESGTL